MYAVAATASTDHIPGLKQLPAGYRPMGVGEVVQVGDYVQIYNTYYPITCGPTCQHVLHDGEPISYVGPFSHHWTPRP